MTTAELAARADFALGPVVVSPSARTIAGPGGIADVEPRVMQVLVCLADAAGQVVTRRTLFDRCWGGAYVGDDSLNRAIGAVRKLTAEIAHGSLQIETIPRTGYRLTGTGIREIDGGKSGGEFRLSRRTAVSAALAIGALAGSGLWWSANQRQDSRFEALIDRAYDQMVKQTADENTARALQQAISIHPDSPKAWGLLALLKSFLIPGSAPKDAARLVDESEKAARHALSLDPKQPDALLAMFELQGSTLDWIARDGKLRQILAIDPNHIWALAELGAFTAATGLIRESWDLNERGLALEPLSSEFLGERALKLWVFERTPEADKVSDQLRALYPADPWAWFVRAQIYAFTGRAGAALEMLDSGPTIPPMADLWRASLPAVADPTPGNVARAREACIRTARTAGMATNEAILVMSGLRDVDTAFEIASGSLLSRGRLVPRERPGGNQAAEDAGWRVNTQWMWAPPVAAMRADPRFLPLCDGVGLVDYWKRRGVKPDFLRASSRS